MLPVRRNPSKSSKSDGEPVVSCRGSSSLPIEPTLLKVGVHPTCFLFSAHPLKNSPMITALCPRVPLTLDPMNWRAVTKVTVKSHLSGVTIANCRTPHYPRPPIAGNWPLKSVKLVSPTSAADVGSAPQRLRSKLLNIDGGLSKQ